MLNLPTTDPYQNMQIPAESEIAARLPDHRGRGESGRFTWKGTLSVMSDNDFPPDSLYWRGYALGAMDAFKELLQDKAGDCIELIFPGKTIQSYTWRTICEMIEAAVKLARAGEQDIQKIAEAAHAELEKLIKERKPS